MARSTVKSVPKSTHDEIATRIRALYRQKGRLPRHDLENWLEAEVQLMTAVRAAKNQKAESRAVKLPGRH